MDEIGFSFQIRDNLKLICSSDKKITLLLFWKETGFFIYWI